MAFSPTQRRVSAAGFPQNTLAILLLVSLAGGCASAAQDPPVLSAWGTALVDGTPAAGEWASAATLPLPAELPDGTQWEATLRAMNDETDVYLVLEGPANMLQAGMNFHFMDSEIAEGDDVLDLYGWAPASTPFEDRFLHAGGPGCTPGVYCHEPDTEYGGTRDGAGASSLDGQDMTIEVRHPLDSQDDAHDVSLSPGQSITLITTSTASDPHISWTATFLVASPPFIAVVPECAASRERCGLVGMRTNVIELDCTARGCVELDPLPRNCTLKYPCPVCPAGGPCPPFHRLEFDGLDDDWKVALYDFDGAPVEHQLERTADGLALVFRPSRELYRDGEIGDYVLAFIRTRAGAGGDPVQVPTRISIVEGPLRP